MSLKPTFALAVLFRIKTPFADQFLARILQQAHDSIANEPGCLQFDVLVNESDASQVFLYETYADTSAFEAHRQTPYFADYLASTADWIESKEVQRLKTVLSSK